MKDYYGTLWHSLLIQYFKQFRVWWPDKILHYFLSIFFSPMLSQTCLRKIIFRSVVYAYDIVYKGVFMTRSHMPYFSISTYRMLDDKWNNLFNYIFYILVMIFTIIRQYTNFLWHFQLPTKIISSVYTQMPSFPSNNRLI